MTKTRHHRLSFGSSSASAFMELVTSNNQGELSPLEIGIHALKAVPKAEGGRGKKGGLRSYADQVGKNEKTLRQWRNAAEVAKNCGDIPAVFLSLTYQLEALHDLPPECWPAACEWLAANKDAKEQRDRRIFDRWLACWTDEENAEEEGIGRVTVTEIMSEFADLPKTTKSARAAAEHATDFDRWLACWTLDEIGEEEGIAQNTLSNISSEFADLQKLMKSDRARAEHATDFDPPIYNIWKQQEKTAAELKQCTQIASSIHMFDGIRLH